jgi:hypothetical protein
MMGTAMSTTWPCPSCKRRVPLQLLECRCGMRRPAQAMAPAMGQPQRRPAPRGGSGFLASNSDWGWLLLFVALFVGSALWGFLVPGPPKPPPLLGVLDPPRPQPSRPPSTPPSARP